MAGLLRRLLGQSPPHPAPIQPGGAPALRVLTLGRLPAAIYAVGDVHGCAALYRRMEQRILEDAHAEGIEGPKLIVLLGDMVDRGPDSAGVLRHLMEPAPAGFQRLMLRGNHEEMMLAFLDNPATDSRWLNFGGSETLMSYGLHPDPEHGFRAQSAQFQHALDLAVPDSHRALLRKMPMALQVGGYIFAHAGIDAALELQKQDPARLLWGDPEDYTLHVTQSSVCLVHGHVIVPEVQLLERRINLDTGAYESGRLSAVRLQESKAPYVLSVTGNPV